MDAVVISGGEPTLQRDLARFIRRVKDMGFLIKLDTNGTNPDLLESLIEQGMLDYVAMDIKLLSVSIVRSAVRRLTPKGLKEASRFFKGVGWNTSFAPPIPPSWIRKIFWTLRPALRVQKSMLSSNTGRLIPQAGNIPGALKKEACTNQFGPTSREM